MRIINFIVIIPAIVWQGWVFKSLWSWFIAPISGLPQIGLAQSVGIVTIMSLVTYRHQKSKPDESEEEAAKKIFNIFFIPLIRLVIGYVAHLFM